MNNIVDMFANQPLMAIMRGLDPRTTVDLATKAWDLGIDLVEVTLQDAEAVPSLQAAIAAGVERGKVVGAGTITIPEQARLSRDLGAAFTVAPGLDPDVVAACEEVGIPHLPGVATATELQSATRLGCEMVKAFPASVLGPGWLKAMRGPFPRTRFVATGGIDATNAEEFLDAGAQTVAVGSALSDPVQLERLTELLRSRRAS